MKAGTQLGGSGEESKSGDADADRDDWWWRGCLQGIDPRQNCLWSFMWMAIPATANTFSKTKATSATRSWFSYRKALPFAWEHRAEHTVFMDRVPSGFCMNMGQPRPRFVLNFWNGSGFRGFPSGWMSLNIKNTRQICTLNYLMIFLQLTHLEIPQLWGWFSFPTIIYGTLRLIAFTHFHPFPTALPELASWPAVKILLWFDQPINQHSCLSNHHGQTMIHVLNPLSLLML